jgi:hypothetical protein
MEKDTVILPKGTIINLNGFGAELIADTLILSPTIKEFGLKNVIELVSECPSSNVGKSGNVKKVGQENLTP